MTCLTKDAIFTGVMKMTEVVKMEGAFRPTALRILRQIPGITVLAEPPRPDGEVDAHLLYSGVRRRVAVEVKQRANAATAWHMVQIAQGNADTPLVLIADETSADARAILREHGVGVIDALGNAHVELPGLLLHLEGRRRPRATRPARLTGRAGLIAQALLLQPERRVQVVELARETGTSVGLAHRILARLEVEGLVAAEGRGPTRRRRVTDPAALLDLWAEEQDDRPIRTLAYLLAPGPRALVDDLAGGLGAARIAYAITGAAAASLIAPSVTAVPVVEVWVPATAATGHLLEAAGAEEVTHGNNVVFLQAKDDAPLAYRDEAQGVWVGNRFRIYADLRRDPRRGREQAEYLRREVIGF